MAPLAKHPAPLLCIVAICFAAACDDEVAAEGGPDPEACAAVADADLLVEFDRIPPWSEDAPLPQSLAEAVTAIGPLLSERQRLLAACHDPEAIAIASHHGLGRELRNHWPLNPGSPLGDEAHAAGFLQVDGISAYLVAAFAGKSQGRAVDLDATVAAHRDAWRRILEASRPDGSQP